MLTFEPPKVREKNPTLLLQGKKGYNQIFYAGQNFRNKHLVIFHKLVKTFERDVLTKNKEKIRKFRVLVI